MRQQEAAMVAAATARRQESPPHNLPARPVAPKLAPIPRPSTECYMSQQEWRQCTVRWSRYKFVAQEPWNYSETLIANELGPAAPKSSRMTS